jgi:hypothetical protein
MNIQQQIQKLRDDYEANPTLERLSELRSAMVAIQDANNASDGFRRLLTDLYPDTAHFVYELLQNAQDASKNNATPSKVTFILFQNKLEFEHYGEKLFDVRDIDAITSLGVSTKRDDNTSIGKFGVGFKSVFAYSNTPEIHSGNEHFKIEELFVPVTDGVSKLFTNGKTIFILPFNNQNKSQSKAEYEIERELRGLGTETLLFLNNINEIEYLLPDGNTLGSMLCKRFHQTDENIIEIRVRTPSEEERVFFWLRYTKGNVPIVSDNGKSIDCSIAIAYVLEKDESKGHKGDWKINTTNQGKVCIFFPAEKETSNLRFYIHAPFASTVARDSVRDCDANNFLRNAISELVVDSLLDIKARGLLTVDFLSALPIEQDGLTPFYEQIRQQIISAFKSQALLPTKSGSYAPAEALFWGPTAISDVIDDEDLALLTESKTPLWVKNAPLNNSREDKFIDSLDIDDWSWYELWDIFTPESDEEREKIVNWISTKPDAWLMRLYALFNNDNFTEIGQVDSDLKIIRTTKGKHVKASEAYFVPVDNGDMPDELNFVKPGVYKTGDADKRKKDAEEFLDILGVRRYNDREKVVLRLKHYRDNPNGKIDQQYWEDISYFVDYSAKHPKDSATFANVEFLLGDADNKTSWVTAAQLHFPLPESEYDIVDLVDGYIPYRSYNEGNLGAAIYAEFEPFLKRIGVKTHNEAELLNVRVGRYINNAEISLEVHLKDMLRFSQSVFDNKVDSQLNQQQILQVLQDKCFVLGEDDQYHKPSEISVYPMSSISDIHKFYGISEKYSSMLDYVDRLVRKLGAIRELKIITNGYNRKDYTIEHLDEYISQCREHIEIPMLLLDLAIRTKNASQYKFIKTRQDRRYNFSSSEVISLLVSTLSEKEWLPTADGCYEKPRNISKSELHPQLLNYFGDFDKNNDGTLLQVIQFGRDVQIEENTQIQVDVLAELYRCAEELNSTPDELIELGIKSKREQIIASRPVFPTNMPKNPDHRAMKLQTEVAVAETKSYEQRQRSVRVSESAGDKSIYLRDMYTNEDEQMVCQCCCDEMPFRKRNKQHYFEAVEIFDKNRFKREHEAVYLALCPVCAAKYKEFVKSSQEQLQQIYEEIYTFDFESTDNYKIAVQLDELSYISFTEKHLLDVRAVLVGGVEHDE